MNKKISDMKMDNWFSIQSSVLQKHSLELIISVTDTSTIKI